METGIQTPRGTARQARQVFLRQVTAGLPQVAAQLHEYLAAQLDLTGTMAEVQERRDLYQLFQKQRDPWLAGAQRRLDSLLHAPVEATVQRQQALSEDELVLVEEAAVETQILAARAALAAIDKGSGEFNDLRLRLQHLEGTTELDKGDAVQALRVAEAVVDAWLEAGFSREHWESCQAVLLPPFALAVADAYQEANRFLLEHGVLPEIDLRGLVRRTPSLLTARQVSQGQTVPEGAPGTQAVAGAGHVPGASGGVSQAVPGSRLMRLLSERVPAAAHWAGTAAHDGEPLPAVVTDWAVLEAALRALPPVDWTSLEAGAAGLHAQTRALKERVGSDQEKAVIEIVALIFDSILTEERIPPSLRVWFARLQMPVLRHAMSDPGFLASEQHPARLLIDRMGSCVMGFDPAISLAPLEQEIKRIVQVIEQYPETGRRVFELMYKEFQVFLGEHLSQSQGLRKIADVAQQLEQKEALTVQYTIELRKLLGQAPLRDALRDFFYHVWAEVMAQAAVTYGAGDPRAQRLQQASGDLLWAASAKSTRHERAQVIARVPALLAVLRDGMALLGYDKARQDAALKPVNDTLADAFMSRTAVVDPGWIGTITQTLAGVEDLLPAQDAEDLPLNRDSLELITGADASSITVLPDTGAAVRQETRAQVRGLPLGGWFRLEHNGQAVSAQLAWQSPRKQLYLFATAAQHAFLMQQGRVAQYLQAGLLRPVEGEGLFERATRSAIEKLDANPERLLS
ncbi:DUF1631 family protein [Hydrogenophaga aquatica]